MFKRVPTTEPITHCDSATKNDQIVVLPLSRVLPAPVRMFYGLKYNRSPSIKIYRLVKKKAMKVNRVNTPKAKRKPKGNASSRPYRIANTHPNCRPNKTPRACWKTGENRTPKPTMTWKTNVAVFHRTANLKYYL